jgi:hypothetical protein
MSRLVGSARRLTSQERTESSRFFELARWASRAEPSRARFGSFPLVVCMGGKEL